MTSASILKIVASVSALIVASSAAFVFGFARVQDRLAADSVSTAVSVPQAVAAIRSDASSAAPETPPAGTASQAPPSLAAALPDPAAIGAELAGPPEAVGKDRFLPSFDIARVEADGDAVIAGRAPPGATVDLMRGDERLDRAIADAAGEFTMVPPRLPAGSYELTLSATLPDGSVTSSKHGAPVAINAPEPSAPIAPSRADNVPQIVSQPQLSSEPRSPADRPQESAGLEPVHASHVDSASDKGASSPAAAHGISNRVITRGDSLWRISRIAYGDGSRYALVYRANRDRIRNPNLIYPGQTLVVPEKRN